MHIAWNSRRGKLALFMLGLFVLLFEFSARAASPDDRACYANGPRARGDLEDGQNGVLRGSGKFDFERMQYRFEALSLWGSETPTSYKTCFRYEIKNLSSRKMEAVSWPDTGMEFVDIDKADRSRWTNPSLPPHPAVTDMSEIKAFERSSDLVPAYLPTITRRAAGLLPSAMDGTGFAEFDLRDSMPEAIKVLELANLPTRRVTVMSLDALPNRTALLTSEFSNGTLAFEHTSTAFYEGKTIFVSQSINFFRVSSETEFSAPYISALNSLTSPVDTDAVSRFASVIREMKGQWNKLNGGKWNKTVTAPIGGGATAIFIVNYPVTVRTKDEILYCVSLLDRTACFL
jgi:hypothetical protein